MAPLKKIKGTTLVESLVALTIIMAVFGAGMMVFLNITKTQNKLTYFRAKSKILEIVSNTKEKQLFFDDDIKDGKITYSRIVDFYQEKQYLLWISVKAYNEKKKTIATHNELVIDETAK